MRWIQAGSYVIQPTKEGLPVIEMTSLPGYPKDASVVYDGGENALFFRNTEVGVILDKLNPHVRQLLMQAEEVGVMELSPTTDNVAPIYRVPVIHSEDKINATLYKKEA